MRYRPICISIFCLFLCFSTASAQQFLPAINRFSAGKPGYLILKTGERIDFLLEDLSRRKGLIIRIKGVTLNGQRVRYDADAIREAGLPPSDYAQMMAFGESTRSIAKMQRSKVIESGRELVVFYNERLDDQ